MATIFIDEAGYTGQNLLDPEQPVFSLASIRIEEAEAQKMKAEFFGGVKANELKYSSIKKRHKKALSAFIAHLRTKPEIVKLTIVLKRYAVLGKMLDLLVEPAMRRDGIDFYEDGLNIALTNVLFHILPAMEGTEFFEDVLQKFQALLSERTLYNYALFFGTVMHHHYADKDNTFKLAIASGLRTEGLKIFSVPRDTLNLAVTAALVLVNFWRYDLGPTEPMTIIHDRSSQLKSYKPGWDRLVGPDMPREEVGYDRRKYQFPLSVEKTFPDEDSRNWAGLQLADVLAGAARDFANSLVGKTGADPPLAAQLNNLLNDETFFIHSIWPSDRITPEQLGTTGGGTSYERFHRLWEEAASG